MLIDYVNVFQGNGEIDLPKPEGIAATWRFLKAQCGNTSPYAAYPFGKMTCGPYTGGYPTGYGNHRRNACGGVKKFDAYLKGFSHLQQSGTGDIKVFYNYALVSPKVDGLGEMNETITEEYAKPGMYSCMLGKSGIKATVAVDEERAYHKYIFKKEGIIQIDFSAAGLSPETDAETELPGLGSYCEIKDGYLLAKVIFRNIPLYFAAACDNAEELYLWSDYKRIDDVKFEIKASNTKFGGVFSVGNTAEVRVAVSKNSFEDAITELTAKNKGIDDIIGETAEAWEKYLSRVQIKTSEDKIKEIFYSNLYHSMIKPCNWDGEYTDFATMWDLYKTQLPLVFTLYKENSKDIIETLISSIEKVGHSLININIAEDNDIPMQARMLMEYSFADGFFRGIEQDRERMLKAAKTDLMYNKDDIDNKKIERYTHILDVADACGSMSEIAKMIGNDKLAEIFGEYKDIWKDAYDAETGLLSEKSPYYEGDKWNYSFRLLRDMEERIKISGGKDNMLKQLDYFFGYTRKAVEQLSEPNGNAFLEGVHSFEGFNNEPDMETPYSYTFLERHDKVCEVVRAGMRYMFTDGRGGLPGNNDSGGLSSCYIWNAIGLFPVTGQNLMLIGSPIVEEAELKLSNGNRFKVIAYNNSAENIYVNRAVLNGAELDDYMLTVTEMMQGGTLELYMDAAVTKK